MLDIEAFLLENHIAFTPTKDGVVIHCVFCGDADPSQHLAWHRDGYRWHCWRNPEHANRQPHRLIMRLTGCSYEQAAKIVGSESPSLDALNQKRKNLTRTIPKPQSLKLPKEFKPLSAKGSGLYFANYLQRRGYDLSDIPTLATYYHLRYTTSGPWSHRIIFPLYFEKRLVCWTGRTIGAKTQPRYLTLSSEDGALQSPKELIYNFTRLRRGGVVLALVEGPFDALKVDLYGRHYGVRASCLFGTGITTDQVDLVSELSREFEKIVILGDVGAETNADRIRAGLWPLRPEIVKLPQDVKDPGDLTTDQVLNLVRKLKGGTNEG